MGTISIINRSAAHKSLLESLQKYMLMNNDVYGGISMLPNKCGMIMKFLAPDGDVLKKTILQTWMTIRESIVGIKPNVRKK